MYHVCALEAHRFVPQGSDHEQLEIGIQTSRCCGGRGRAGQMRERRRGRGEMIAWISG